MGGGRQAPADRAGNPKPEIRNPKRGRMRGSGKNERMLRRNLSSQPAQNSEGSSTRRRRRTEPEQPRMAGVEKAAAMAYTVTERDFPWSIWKTEPGSKLRGLQIVSSFGLTQG